MAPREAQLVAREAGALTAREMLLQAAVLNASEMKSRGFLHAVVPDVQVGLEAGDELRVSPAWPRRRHA